MTTIPDFMPNLKDGAGATPEEGGCLMQVTHFLWDGGFGDHPKCTDPMLSEIAITLNDAVIDEARRTLMAAVPDLIGTAWLSDDAGFTEEQEIAAVAELRAWTLRTCPLEVILCDEDGREEDGHSCEDEWVCFAASVQLAICNADTNEGPLTDVDNLRAQLADPQQVVIIERFWGAHTLEVMRETVENGPGDAWKANHYALCAWFVQFVAKYRELFGNKPAPEVTEEQWRKAADALPVAV